MAAPLGNHNYLGGKKYQRALALALEGKPNALRKIAEKAIEDAELGDAKAREHVVERLDGKVVQGISGPDGGPIRILAFTPQQLAALSPDDLAALEAALPVLDRLGIARGGGGGEEAPPVPGDAGPGD